MTFLKDTDGDGKADYKEIPLTGFGCEDSHHALHDFVWTPDGDLIFVSQFFITLRSKLHMDQLGRETVVGLHGNQNYTDLLHLVATQVQTLGE